MLKSFSIKNFKSFSEAADIEIRKITVIVGKNSCGKSSLLQSLLLLKQTLDSSTDKPLCLEGRYLKCSNLKDITYGLPAINKSNIEYSFKFENKVSINTHTINLKNKKIGDQYQVILDSFVSSYCQKENNNKEPYSIDFINIPIKVLKEKWKEVFGTDLRKTEIEDIKLNFYKFLPDNFECMLSENKKHERMRLPLSMFFPNISKINLSELHDTIKGLKYLSPVRAIPERAYVHYTLDVSELNENGSNAAHLLWAKRNQQVYWEGKKTLLKEAVNAAFDCIGLPQKIRPDQLGDILYKIDISEQTTGKEISLTDVGFGYSQILPVILTGLLINVNNIALIEQPEIHLHPSCSANLADLFIKLTNDNRRFIIETHSPEFINKLRLRVIENPKLKDRINIIFVEPNQELGSQIRQFQIDENGMFPEWPEGFLDESEKIAQQILMARVGLKK